MIKVPKLLTKKTLQSLTDKLKLEVRSGQGNSATNTEMVEISNKCKLGLTEFQSIKQFCDGIKKIIGEEEKL